MTVDTETRHRMQDAVAARQGVRCFTPGCSNLWTDLAHIDPSGAGGRPSTWRIDNLMGMCRGCHDIFDGRDMAGRQRMLRDFATALIRCR